MCRCSEFSFNLKVYYDILHLIWLLNVILLATCLFLETKFSNKMMVLKSFK